MLMAYYPQILMLHIASITLSGTVFVLRGLLVQLGRKALALAGPVRYASYCIDIVLLASGVTLAVILPWAMLSYAGWLPIKLVLVVVYVLLGTLAMKRGRSARVRGVCYVAALLTFLYIVGIAIAHHPLSWFVLWPG